MEFLFDPKNPNDDDKHFSPDNTGESTPHQIRFSILREVPTMRTVAMRAVAEHGERDITRLEDFNTSFIQDSDNWQLRFEQMICQINYNANELFKLNPLICFNPGCSWRSNKWVASTIQTVDLEIFDANLFDDEEETFEVMTRSAALTADSIVVGSTKRRNLESLPSIIDEEEGLQYYVAKAKRGTFGNCSDDKIHIIKVGVPGHFTLALYYPLDNITEFFDSGGTWGAVGYDERGDIFSTTMAQRQKLRSHTETQTCTGRYPADKNIEKAICTVFSRMYPESSFVGMISKNLQDLDEDAYCQSWVLLYVYMRFIYSQVDPDFNTTEKCIRFLESKTGEELFELVLGWWKYIIYLPTNIIKSREFKDAFEIISTDRGGGEGRGRGRAAAGAGAGAGGMHGGNINNEYEERACIIM